MMLSKTRSICEVVYFQLRDNQGAARGQMVMLQDIGERVRREEEDYIMFRRANASDAWSTVETLAI